MLVNNPANNPVNTGSATLHVRRELVICMATLHSNAMSGDKHNIHRALN